MAPNVKHRSSHLQSIDTDLAQPVKVEFPPLTSEVAQLSPKVTTVQEGALQDSSYWEWSSENDAEINKIVAEERLSADHIVDNILRQTIAPASSTSAANDQYWDWSHGRTESVDYQQQVMNRLRSQ